MKLCKAQEQDFDKMIQIWESSVRATHNFLLESDIQDLKKLIRNKYFYIKELSIQVLKKGLDIVGFIGISDESIEMLFIDLEHFGKGIGFKLLDYAVKHKNCIKVDVNEQNPRAIRFYQKYGFKVKSRSALYGQGNPFPILHMEL